MTQQNNITQQLIDQVASLSLNEMMYLISEADKQNNTSAKKIIAEAVASDIQSHIDDSELEIVCPECSSIHYKKNVSVRQRLLTSRISRTRKKRLWQRLLVWI